MEATTLQSIFVGREDEQQLYQDFLAQDTPWVLIITGLGGIGKSTLLEHLAQNTTSSISVCKLDFNEAALRTEPLLILQSLAQQMRQYSDVQQIHAFEDTIRQDLDQLEQIRKIKIPAANGNGASPQPGQPAAIEDDAATKEIGRQMREQATESCYELIDGLHLDQLVLMLDTCEWLNEPEGWEVGQWVFNELLPEFHSRLRLNDQRFSVVLVSRVKPQLARIDRQDQQYLPLSMLSQKAVFEYLARAGMHDPALCQRVYDITHGHALSVSIIGAICQEQGEKSLTEEDFPLLQKEFTEKASMQFVDERILSRLASPYRELTRYGVLLRSFNLPLLQAVFFDIEALKGPGAPGIFDHLIRYPYIEPRGNNYYAFHELLREVIAEQVQRQDGPEKERWKSYHRHALEHFSAVAPYSPEWYYHTIASHEEQGMRDWLQALQRASAPQMKALLQVTYDSTLKLSPAARAIRDYEQGRFNNGSIQWLDATGNVQQARDKRKEALQNFEDALQNFREAHDNCGEALAQQAIDALQRPGKAQAAMLKSYWLACLAPPAQQLPLPAALPPSGQQFYASAPTASAPTLPLQPPPRRMRGRSWLLIAAALLIIIAGVAVAVGITRPKTSGSGIPPIHTHGSGRPAIPYPSYLPGGGTLALYDQLRDNSAHNNWDMYSGKGESCTFEGGAYHVLEQNPDTFISCAADKQFDNFAFDIQMTIIKGNCGGMIFRGDNINSKFYVFDVCQNGSYNLYRYIDYKGSDSRTLASDTSATINKGQNRANLIAAVAYNSYLYIYINEQFVASVSDETYGHGQIGVVADNYNGSTEVMFNSVRVWNLTKDPAPVQQDTYTKAVHAKPIFQDQLSTYNIANDWDINDSCQFSGGAYQVTDSSKTNLGWCVANGIGSSSAFIFRVQMTIVKGDAGGIFFRSDSANTMFYYFKVGRDGSYFLYRSRDNGGYDQLLFDVIPSRVNTGQGQPIFVAVMAQGRFLNLFVDNQFIAGISDSTYSSGSIALVAEDDGHPTDVAFNDAQVWKL